MDSSFEERVAAVKADYRRITQVPEEILVDVVWSVLYEGYELNLYKDWEDTGGYE